MHIRTALCEALYEASPLAAEKRGGINSLLGADISKIFQSDPVVCKLLVPGLLTLYVDIQKFHDNDDQVARRQELREKMVELFTFLSDHESHVDTLYEIASGSHAERCATFRRFLLMLTSDLTANFDKAVERLIMIKQESAWLQHGGDWEELQSDRAVSALAGRFLEGGNHSEAFRIIVPQSQDVARDMAVAEGVLHQARDGNAEARQKVLRAREACLKVTEHFASEYMQFTNQDLKIICQLARIFPAAFVDKNVADRVAMSLNSMYKRLMGKGSAMEIKLENPAKYKFDPKGLMKEVVQIYISLHQGNTDGLFIEAVARDERSFSSELFTRGCAILQRASIVCDEDLASFNSFVEDAIAQAEQLK